jgi:O-antigen/teichoic acid export membrane protein
MTLKKNILGTIFTQIPAMLISIIAGIFITRILGPEGKGVFSVYSANAEILALLFAFGTTQGIVYFIANKKISEYKIQAIALSVLFLSIILNFFVVFYIKSEVAFVQDYENVFFKTYLFLLFVVMFSNSLIVSFLKAKKQFKKINVITILSAVLNLIVFATLFVLIKKEVLAYSINLVFIISLVLLFVNLLFYLILFFTTYTFSPNFNLNFKKEILPFYKFSFVGFLGMMVNFLNYRLDVWFVSYYKGPLQLGLYALAVNFAQFIMMISKIVSSVMMPYLSEDNLAYRRKIFKVYSRLNFSIIFILCVVLYFIGEYLLVFLYGEEFFDSVVPFKILIIGMLFTGPSQLFSSYLSASGRNDLCLYTNLTGLLFTLVLDVILIPRYGIIGSAYATLFSYLSIFLVYLGILLIKEKFNFFEMILLRRNDIKGLKIK